MNAEVARYLELRVFSSDVEIPDKLYATDPDRCCELLKVQPTRQAIEEMNVSCWVTGLRCTEGRTRTDFREVEQRDSGLFKLNLILVWHEREVWQYLAINKISVNPLIVACPGSVTCSKGLVDCWAAAANIRDAVGGLSGPDMRICISGCPNNCDHSAVADIGPVGMPKKENGDSVQYYRLLRGGSNGRTDRLAEQWCIVRASDVAAIIKCEPRMVEPPAT